MSQQVISTNPEEMVVTNIKLSDILIDHEWNCRGQIGAADVFDLVRSIEEKGLIQPIAVTPKPDGKYKLIAGFRRSQAFKVLKKTTIPAVIMPVMTDEDCIIFNLAENLERKDLNIIQEAKSIQRLIDMGCGREVIADKVSKSVGWVQIRQMLLTLPEEVQAEVATGMITQSKVRELYSLHNLSGKDACIKAAKQIKEAKQAGREEPVVSPAKKDVNSKRIRTKGEIYKMMDHVIECIGANFATRALAWASGEVTDAELFADIKEYAKSVGKIYEIPTTGIY